MSEPSCSFHRVSTPDLIVVLPVYNEGEIIADTVTEWLDQLDQLAIPYRLHVCNDGSRDNTQEILDGLSHPALELHHARNRGHGPTILRTYRSAVDRAPWVFQCDSDGELPAETFPAFWKSRTEADLVTGTRFHRTDNRIRLLITRVLRIGTLCLFGKGIPDVNCPYRLMRSEAFRPLFDQLPEDTFAPNVLVSAYALLKPLRIRTLPVEHTLRQTGVVSIRGRSLLKAVLRATRQTLAFRFRPMP